MGRNSCNNKLMAKVLFKSSCRSPSLFYLKRWYLFKGSSILDLDPEERSHLGIFLVQYPIEIPGVSNEDFLRLAYNSKQKFYNKPEVDPIEFLTIIYEKLELVNVPLFLSRNVNEGFSWWKNEMKFYKWF
jgi:Fe-S cluster assembly ATP-binding protein